MLPDVRREEYVLHPAVEGRVVNIRAGSPAGEGWAPRADARPTEEEDEEERERQRCGPQLADEDGAF